MQTVAVKCSIAKSKGVFLFSALEWELRPSLILFPLLPGACVWFWPDVVAVQPQIKARQQRDRYKALQEMISGCP